MDRAVKLNWRKEVAAKRAEKSGPAAASARIGALCSSFSGEDVRKANARNNIDAGKEENVPMERCVPEGIGVSRRGSGAQRVRTRSPGI